MTEAFAQAIQLLDQLQPLEQAQLLEQLSRRVARHMATQRREVSPPTDDAWIKLEAFRRDMEAMGSAAPNFGAQLDADRYARLVALGAAHADP